MNESVGYIGTTHVQLMSNRNTIYTWYSCDFCRLFWEAGNMRTARLMPINNGANHIIDLYSFWNQ